ncbi:tautomerase family protein [Streptomyces eurythermus]|uniref:tautomerase family protein n=1 Tax=Streptomyces eurythermus TaxID=42237 RepID=UPI003F4CC248
MYLLVCTVDGDRSVARKAPSGDYPGVPRDDSVVFVAITLRAGRDAGRKRAVYRRIAELVHERTGTEPRNVLVTLTENGDADWSFGYGQAQYAPAGRGPAGASPR